MNYWEFKTSLVSSRAAIEHSKTQSQIKGGWRGRLPLHRELEASLGYLSPCLNKKELEPNVMVMAVSFKSSTQEAKEGVQCQPGLH